MRSKKEIFIDYLKNPSIWKKWSLRDERLTEKYFGTHKHFADYMANKISYEEFLKIDHRRRIDYHIEKYGFNNDFLFLPALFIHMGIELLYY